MLIPAPPLKPRKRAAQANPTPKPLGPVPLTLVAASYDPGGPGPVLVVLVFDRAVNIGGCSPAQILVDDPMVNLRRYDGSGGVSLIDPVTVRVEMTDAGESVSETVVLNASDLTGIVAVDDGGTWAGVTDLELPFP